MNNQLIPVQGSRVENIQRSPEFSSSSSNNAFLSDQKQRDSFANLQEHRLAQLIRGGHITLNSKSILWIDENGLITAQGLLPADSKDLKIPVPFFHVGKDADLDFTTSSPILETPFCGLTHIEKEKKILGSLLHKLVIKHLRRMPPITHLIWKELRITLENASFFRFTYVKLADMLRDAIEIEEEDFGMLDYFGDTCVDLEEFMTVDIDDDLAPALYRLAGINADHSNPGAALAEIDADLANQIRVLLHKANTMQEERAPRKRRARLASRSKKLGDALYPGEAGPLMRQLLEAVKQGEDIEGDQSS